MFSAKIFLIVALCSAVAANDGKIGLEDIEQDNLKSEKAIELEKEDYLQPPSLHAEQTANYGPSEDVNYSKKQYAVEEPSPSEGVIMIYPTGDYHAKASQFVSAQGLQDGQKYQASDAGEQSTVPQSLIGNYLQGLQMQVVYVPQYDQSASNSVEAYSDQTQGRAAHPSQYYQVVPEQQGQVYAQAEQQYAEADKQPQLYTHQIQYITVPQQGHESQVLSADQPQTYILQPQYQPVKSPQQYQNYEGLLQTFAYTNSIADDQQQQVHEEPKYAAPPTEPSKYEGPQLAQISPPTLHSSHYHHAPQLPAVLSKYSHTVSHPVYSHISGNLVQEQYKPSHETNTIHQDHYSPSAHVGNSIREPFRPFYEYYPHRKPTSLLDSYIPSSLQIEYLKRGLSKEPLATYDAIASRGYHSKKYEGGFLPNQMFPTAQGGVTYGHFKRAAKRSSNN